MAPDPAADRPVPQVVSGLLTGDPLVALGFDGALIVHAQANVGPQERRVERASRQHDDLLERMVSLPGRRFH